MRSTTALLAVGMLVTCGGCSDSDDTATSTSTTVTSTTDASPVTGVPPVLDARFSCGPTDAPWIRVSARLPNDTSVVAELAVDGRTTAASEPQNAAAGTTFELGFDPALLPAEHGRHGVVSLRASGSTTVLARDEIALRLPAGESCG